MSQTITCGECRVKLPTLKGAVEHYMAGCGDAPAVSLEEATALVAEAMGVIITYLPTHTASIHMSRIYANMLREWWGCREDKDKAMRDFGDGIAFCFAELGFRVEEGE